MELLDQLGIEKGEEIDIPETHKSLVRNRIEKSVPEDLISWEDARQKLRFKIPS